MRGKKLFLSGSPSRKIMNLIFYCGCLPYRSLRLFKDDPASYHKAALGLIDNGYLESVRYAIEKRSGVRVLLPTDKARREGNYGEEFFFDEDYYLAHGLTYMKTKNDKETSPEYDMRKKLVIQRNITTAECAAFFVALSDMSDGLILKNKTFQMLPGYKPGYDILAGRENENIKRQDMFRRNSFELTENSVVFYTSWELKMGLTEQQARVSSGRAQAMIVNGSHIYSVLNMPAKKRYLIRGRAELDTRITLTMAVQNMCVKDLRVKNETTIVLSNNPAMFIELLRGNNQKNKGDALQSLFSIDDGSMEPRETLYIPTTRDGALILAMIMSDGGREILRSMYAVNPLRSGLNITCDYEEDDKYVLSFFVTDLYRLNMFLKAVMFYKDSNFVLYCYDFMADLVRDFIGYRPNLKIKVKALYDVADKFRNEVAKNG